MLVCVNLLYLVGFIVSSLNIAELFALYRPCTCLWSSTHLLLLWKRVSLAKLKEVPMPLLFYPLALSERGMLRNESAFAVRCLS